MNQIKRVILTSAVFLLLAAAVCAENETLLLRFPDIYKDKIAFSYAGDIWIAGTDGGYARRLTSSPGIEYFPKFSPDGQWISFTGEYDGYFQVFVMPADGGEPKQLTFYPTQPVSDRMGYDKQVMDWTPDGKSIVYRAQQGHWDAFVGRLYKISKDGGFPEVLPFVEGGTLSFSPDGKKLATTRVCRDFRTWKRYKGGMAQNIAIYEFDTEKWYEITDWIGTEHHPIWHGDKIYFVSDNTGVSNLYSYNMINKEIKQITDYKDWDIKWPGYGFDALVFELGGKIYKMNFADEKITPLTINVAYDKAQIRPAYMNVSKNIESAVPSPEAKRIAVVARGELFAVPAEKGDPRNLSKTPGVRERDAVWSPDGKWIAYISDATGNEELYLTDSFGTQKIQLTKDSKQLLYDPLWSPDSKKIALRGEIHDFYYVDVASKKMTKVDTTAIGRILDYTWAPDSNWLTYSKQFDPTFSAVYLYSLSAGKVYQVTDLSADNQQPVFDPAGKYLYFISARDFQAQYPFYEGNFFYDNLQRVYAAALKATTPSPFEPESDEVSLKAEEKKDDDSKKEDEKKKEPVKIEIDIEGLGNRVAALPVPPGNVLGLDAVEGAVFYIKAGAGGAQTLYSFNFKERKEESALDSVLSYRISPDGKKILWRTADKMGVADAKPGKIDTSKGIVDVSKLETAYDPVAEWKEMLAEVHRLMKATFYVENMHGIDWPAMYKKYSPLVQYVAHRRDLTYLIGEMIGEVGTSHSYTGGGYFPAVENQHIGLLGAEFEVDANGYYKISRILQGENWISDNRSPLTQPGIKAKAGDYILEINGVALKAPESPYHLLERTLGTAVTLKLNSAPADKGSWTVKVEPVKDETELRYLTWVENNRKYVEKITNGRIGYVHVPDMGDAGLNQFVKTWYTQLGKEGIIIDDRYNGGGFVSSFILERLRRIVVGMRASRIFGMGTYPDTGFAGHLIMITNMYAASDGDNFPNFFRQYKLGPVIGTRTWGGVVGYTQVHPLMDGGYLIVPQSGSYNLKGEWWMENEGVTPDLIIDTSPVDQAKGRDPQLDKAIEMIMKKVTKEPVKLPPIPPDPVKTK
jgi:tricorn protease